jgi:hypothetical protein
MASMRESLDRHLHHRPPGTREPAPELSPEERAVVERFEHTPSALVIEPSTFFSIAMWSYAWTCHHDDCDESDAGYKYRADAEDAAQAHADTHVVERRGR